MVHSKEDYEAAVEASEILFSTTTTTTTIAYLQSMKEEMLLSVFNGVPKFEVPESALDGGIGIIDLLAEKTSVFGSKGEARRAIAGGGVSLNKTRVETQDEIITSANLIANKYLLVQKGKKNYYLIIAF